MTTKTSQTIDDILNEVLGIQSKTPPKTPPKTETTPPPSAESVLEVVRWLKGCCESAEKRLKRIINPDSAKPPKPARSWREWPTFKRLQGHIARQDFEQEEFMLDFSKMLYAMSKRMTPTAINEIVGREFLDNPAIPLEDRIEMMRIVEHLPSNSTLQRSSNVV